MTEAPPDLLHRLRHHGQEHLLTGWADLWPGARVALVEQLAGLDFAELEALYAKRAAGGNALPGRGQIAPIPVEDGDTISPAARELGEQALRAGEVAVLVVAGGQGSRLGFDKPKGMFPVGPVSGATLFRVHAEKVLALSRKYGREVPYLVMTSPVTHAETLADFEAADHFGLPRGQVTFFQQGTMPALDAASGKLLLSAPGQLFLSPNGHGGTLTALADTGLLADLKSRGVRHVFYFQVDNPLVDIASPAFLGRHIETGSEASSKVVFKERPDEKVGVLALVSGRCGIVEYSDLPADLAAERDPAGELRYRAGNTAIHLFSVPFLERVTAGAGRLDYHLARKKVPYHCPEAGGLVTPTAENALKFELFIFDALPSAERWLVVSTRREEEFAPLKNATGADSESSVRQAISDFHARRLRAAGASLPTGPDGRATVPVEVSPLFALTAGDVAAKIPPGTAYTGAVHLKELERDPRG